MHAKRDVAFKLLLCTPEAAGASDNRCWSVAISSFSAAFSDCSASMVVPDAIVMMSILTT